jgi:hypothetical protein
LACNVKAKRDKTRAGCTCAVGQDVYSTTNSKSRNPFQIPLKKHQTCNLSRHKKRGPLGITPVAGW